MPRRSSSLKLRLPAACDEAAGENNNDGERIQQHHDTTPKTMRMQQFGVFYSQNISLAESSLPILS